MRTLADLDLAAPDAAGSAFAEKLGTWVSFTDAIALSAVHGKTVESPHAVRTPKATVAATAPVASLAPLSPLAQDVENVRAGLVNAITQRSPLAGGRAPIRLPDPPHALPLGAAAYEPYRRYYAAHQREMEASVGALRARVRARLATVSPALQQLAALDAVLDTTLCERENKLLSKVASLMQKRFLHWLKTCPQDVQADADGTLPTNPPVPGPKDGGWLARFCHEVQTVLLAELDLRLQPTLGLLEACMNETQTTT